jgi:DNA repair protein RadC
LPKSERPRERLARLGAEYLSLPELLAILISAGTRKGKDVGEIAVTLLNRFDGNITQLFSASIEELSTISGIGFVKACQIKAVFELATRIAAFCEHERPRITSTDDVVVMVSPRLRHLKQEQFLTVLLDSKGKVIKCKTISVGSLDSALVHPRDVFRPAIVHSASSLIVVHNHPSGDPTPSDEDILLTRELCMCGKLLYIDILDHIIIGDTDYVSLKHRGFI